MIEYVDCVHRFGLTKVTVAVSSIYSMLGIILMAGLCGCLASPAVLRPGCIVEDIGEIVPVRSSVILVIQMDLLGDVHSKVLTLHKNVTSLANRIHDMEFQLHEKFSLQARLTQLDTLFSPVIGDHTMTREKRGIAGVAGYLAMTLIGLMLDSSMKRGFNTLQSSLKHNSILINRTLSETHNLHAALDNVIVVTNELTDEMGLLNEKVDDQLAYTLLSNELDTLYNEVHLMTKLYEDFVTAIVSASQGTVLPSLIPLPTLRSVILEAQVKHQLIPIIEDPELVLYYPFLVGSLYHDSLTISIPFRPATLLSVFRIHAFPFQVDGILSTIQFPQQLLLFNDGMDRYSLMDETDFSDCIHGLPLMHVCVDYTVLEHTIQTTSCVRSILLNLDLTETCEFQQIQLDRPFHKRVHGHHYLYFGNVTHATAECDEKTRQFAVHGAYILPITCSFSSLHSTILPVKHITRSYIPRVPHLTLITPFMPRNKTIALPRHLDRLPTLEEVAPIVPMDVVVGLSITAIVIVVSFVVAFLCLYAYCYIKQHNIGAPVKAAQVPNVTGK